MVLAAFLTVSASGVPLAAAAAEPEADGSSSTLTAAAEPDETADALYTEQTTYSDYYDRYAGEPRPDAAVTIAGRDYLSFDAADKSGISTGSCGEEYGAPNRDNVLIWDEADGTLTYEAEIPETGRSRRKLLSRH